ncbi:hypothetical protein [Rossellomorea marisflavi]|uniref:hypothetical protein n=1 Tax=Rossellomorea TaxID=2837508 RepID=UPI00064FDB9C|nr:hypothetical protein [Rossellomorea marisflavi]MBV6685760.1 hypothetical protein [Bacillus sp. JRC01]VXB69246.1 conserved hypothetical protein [Bacillus sp. 349Y]KML07860.1 hypothetical protein VL06_03055 [Rossellomorea marisflavi]KML32038.1 hypothetical protein VL12_17165 [Rossellomorea marisflavi]QHA37867.1 hypothetical protein D5E69_20210 [Rossellomorea marisflavi]
MSERTVIAVPRKSVGLSLVLTFFFGSLGMLYSTVAGALIMIAIEFVVGFLTFGIGLFFTHIVCMIWGAVAASNYNNRVFGQ